MFQGKLHVEWSTFQTFDITGPFQGTVVPEGTAASENIGSAIGDCLTDQFSVTSPGNRGSPIICGFNTGQHSNN